MGWKHVLNKGALVSVTRLATANDAAHGAHAILKGRPRIAHVEIVNILDSRRGWG